MDLVIMKLNPTIDGTSTLSGFEKQIELLSFSHGVSMQITGDVSNTERTSGKPNHQDFTLTKYLDLSSAKLNESCCKGDNFTDVTITIGRNDKGAVLPIIIYTLKNVVISSVSVGGGSGDKPVETLTLNYNHITWDYHAQKEASNEAGHVTTKWDLSKNVPS